MRASRSGHYAWAVCLPSQHELDDEALLEQNRRLFEASRKSYGSLRVQRQLRYKGIVVGHNCAARLSLTGHTTKPTTS